MRHTSEWLRSSAFRTLILTMAALGIIGALGFSRIGQNLENHNLDLYYRLRPAPPQPQDLLIVGIDEPSFKEIGLTWPWPRRLHAALVDRLAQLGARLIIFDVLFAEATQPEDDARFANSLRRAGNVILAETIDITKDPRFSRHIMIEPLPLLRSAARTTGLMMVTPDADGVVRHFHYSIGGRATLPAAAMNTFSPPGDIPTALSGLINYAGPPRSIDTVSYYQILDPEHPLPPSRVHGRVVLVGRILEASITPQAQTDTFYTPFYASTGQLMSGVEVHGHIIHTLLTRSWGQELPLVLRLGLAFLLLAGATVLLHRLRLAPALTVLSLIILLIFAGSFSLFVKWRLWFPPSLISLGLVMLFVEDITGKYLTEYRERRWLRQAFGRYVSPALVEAIVTHPERLKLGGEEAEVTVLFADLAGFTGLAEEMPPESLIQLLNEYFTTMTQIIQANQGTVDKFIGDALMAVWGAPVAMTDHATLACRAALAMQHAMRGLKEGWRSQGLPQLSARMGLHSGRVLAGNVGSLDRFDYTVMGDTVNLASRLESVNKRYGTVILLSEDTYQNARAGGFLFRELDRVQVKGRLQPVTIYELVGARSSENEPPWLPVFASGRSAYLAQDWQQAMEHFQEVLRLKPDDPPSQVFLQRCRLYREAPPAADWEGVFVLDEK